MHARGRGGTTLSIQRLRTLSWISVLVALGLILLLTWTPVAAVGSGCLFGVPCNAGHPIAFAVLGAPLAGLFATSRMARESPRRALAAVFFALWIIAAVDELVQPYVGRDASLQDWALDMVGGVTAFLGGSVVLRLVGGRLGWFTSGGRDDPAESTPASEVQRETPRLDEAPRAPSRRRRRRR